jgi:hypothetical protein
MDGFAEVILLFTAFGAIVIAFTRVNSAEQRIAALEKRIRLLEAEKSPSMEAALGAGRHPFGSARAGWRSGPRRQPVHNPGGTATINGAESARKQFPPCNRRYAARGTACDASLATGRAVGQASRDG